MATRPYNSPLLLELQALGVLFATPPEGSANMAGVVFDEAGEPTQLQNLAGDLKDFPGGGGGSGIPIPANNDGNDVVINSAGGGAIQIQTTPDVDGLVGDITVAPESATGDGSIGASSFLRGGTGVAAGGSAEVSGGSSLAGATGAQVLANGAPLSGDGGDLELVVGASGANNGKLILRARSGSLAVAAGTSTVTIAGLGPAAGNLEVSNWIPATLDGVDGFLPFLTVVP